MTGGIVLFCSNEASKKNFKNLQHSKNANDMFCIWTECWAYSLNLKEARSRCSDAGPGVFVIEGRGFFFSEQWTAQSFPSL